MPISNLTLPDRDSRKALEQRARYAVMPVASQKKGRWPFPVADSPAAQSDHEADPAKRPEQPGKWRE